MKPAFAVLSAILAATAFCEDEIRLSGELDRLLMSGDSAVRKFNLEGRVVMPCTPLRKSFYLDDGSGIVQLADNARWPELFFKEGDLIRVSGQTVVRPGGLVNADCATVDVIQRGELPVPAETPLRNLVCEHGRPLRRIRTRGMVRDVFQDDIDPAYVSLVLSTGRDTLYVFCNCNPAILETLQRLVGAEVVATGLIRSDNNLAVKPGLQPSRGSRWIMGPSMRISDTNDIQVVQPPPADAFDVPNIGTLKTTRPDDIARLGRHRTCGSVIAVLRQNGFILKTGDGRIVNVDLANGPAPRPGETVSVVGLPTTDLYRINLVRAVWKPAPPSRQRSDPPVAISAKRLLTDGKGHPEFKIRFHGARLRLNGIVRTLPAPGEPIRKVTIDDEGHALDLISDLDADPFASLEIGDTVEATGVCAMDVEQWRPDMVFPNIKRVSIVVTSPEDIRIVAKASWWTTSRLATLAWLMALTATGVLIWNLSLRVLVARRSRALLREQAKRLTETLRVKERTRLAAELHDTVAQNLSGLSLQLDAAERIVDRDPHSAKSILSFTSKALLACRRELKDCLWDLHCNALDEKDMNDAIRRALTPYLHGSTLATRFSVPRRKIADRTAHAVLRILCELACNAIRHGKAKNIWIAGSFDNGKLKFSCADDGCGFDVAHAPGSADGHFGLQGIRDRVRAFGGAFNLTSTPGKGTKAVIHLNHAPREN